MEKIILKDCPKCGIQFNSWTDWGIKKFCSRSCGNSRGPRTDKEKKNISLALKTSSKAIAAREKQKQQSVKIEKVCPVCDKTFLVHKSEENCIYCSRKCYLKDTSTQFRKQTSGGYREGSGRAKTGYYKGMYCGSTYELIWVIYQLDHDVKFSRFPGMLEKDGVKYYPDFLIDNTIVEIKGYESQDSVDKKTKIAEYYGYTVCVLRKDDLKKEFEWVKQNYRYKELYELYDGYKPKYNLICSNCGNEFFRNNKPKTNIVFCGRVCAGKGHKGKKVKSRSSSGKDS